MGVPIVLQDTEQWVENYGQMDLNYIYSTKKFAWNYLFINISEYIMLDIFYKLLKGVVDSIYILQQFKIIIRVKFTKACVKVFITKSF